MKVGLDVMWCLMENFDKDATHVQLAALTKDQIEPLVWHETRSSVQPAHLEPRVPSSAVRWDQFQAHAPLDFICLARSPEFTPPASDALFDKIREHFIDETAR